MKNKGDVNNKRGEIQRLLKFLGVKNWTVSDLSEKTMVSTRTINNTIWNDDEIGARLLRSLHSDLGVSLDWLLSGDGDMFLAERFEVGRVHFVGESPTNYGVDEHDKDKALIADYENYDDSTLQDYWWLAAKAVERSLIQAGAVPETDYSIKDCYQLSQAFVLKRFIDVELKL